MGTKYPLGESPVWPPRDWTCPTQDGGCGKYHSQPHFAHKGNVSLNNSNQQRYLSSNKTITTFWC